MTNPTTPLFSSLMMVVFLFVSCSKKTDPKSDALLLDDKNLTPCQAGADCQQLFSEQADIDPERASLKPGNYRIFWSSVKAPVISSVLYIKAPMQGISFVLTKKDILAGRVKVVRSCPACYMIASKPVDGYVTGLNMTPGNSADQSKWILEAKIIMQAEGNVPVRDTVYIKQRFYPNFIIN